MTSRLIWIALPYQGYLSCSACTAAAATGPASQSVKSVCSCSSCLLGLRLRMLPCAAAAAAAVPALDAAAAVVCSSCKYCGLLTCSCRKLGHTAANSISVGSCSGLCRYDTARTLRHRAGLLTAPATPAGASGARSVRCVAASCSSCDSVLQVSRRYTTTLAGMPGGLCCVCHQSHTIERPLNQSWLVGFAPAGNGVEGGRVCSRKHQSAERRTQGCWQAVVQLRPIFG